MSRASITRWRQALLAWLRPASGFVPLKATRFLQNQKAIRIALPAATPAQSVDLDLSCNTFEPSSQTIDYATTPDFSHRTLTGAAFGIRVESGAVERIGRLGNTGLYTLGANVWPVHEFRADAPSTPLNRGVRPDNDVNSPIARIQWRSPQDWISVSGGTSNGTIYKRFRNEWLGANGTDPAIAERTGGIQPLDATAQTSDCQYPDFGVIFPTRQAAVTTVSSDSSAVTISPNPASDEFEIAYRLGSDELQGMFSLVITSAVGNKPVLSEPLNQDSGIRRLSASLLPPGAYRVRLVGALRKPVSATLIIVR